MLAEQPRPAGAAPSPLSYRPHKMERYYAEHILQTHFGHSSDGGCGGGEGEQPGLHVHGRDAVPFLTTSGMDRNVLRCIWSVVDPGGIGTLLDMSQVHAMLRLVALGQAGLLPPGAPPDREAYAGALAMYSHQVVTLPTFSAIGDVPSAAFLISNYAPAVGGDNGGSSVGEAAAFDQNFQYRLWQQQEQQKMLARSLGVAESASEMSMDSPGMGGSAPAMSIGDAFADLGPSEDRALPSEDFRDFAEASDEDEDEVHGNAIASIDEEAAVITTDRSGDDDGEKTVGFGSFNDGGTAAIGMEDQAPPSDPPPPVPPQEPSSLKAEVDQVPMDQREHQSWDTEQVGADNLLAHASAMQPQVTKEAQFPTSDDPFAVMGAMEDAPLPPLPSAGPPAPPAEVDVAEDGEEDGDEEEGDDDEDGDEGDDDEDDDFGNFEEVKAVGAEIDNNLSSVEEVPTASKGGSELATEDLKGDLFASSQGVLVVPSDDPFAVMGAMEDAPLPPLPSAGPPAPPAEVDVAEDGDEGDDDEEEGDDDEDGDEGDDDEDDDFGNFEEVKAVGAEIDNNLSSVEEVPTASKGGSELATEDLKGDLFASSQGVLVAPSDDPFAVMGAMEDAPLPPLPSAGPPAPPAEVDVAEDGEEDGDEGDDDEGDDDEDGDEGDDDEDDDFGNFEEVKAVGAEIDNNLSSVEEVPTASKGGSELATEDLKGDLFASSQGVLVAPSDDPFAVMGAMEDAPLPPLPSAGPPAPPAEVDVAEDGEEDGDEEEGDDDEEEGDDDEDGDEGDDDEDDDFGNFEEVKAVGAEIDNNLSSVEEVPTASKGGSELATEDLKGDLFASSQGVLVAPSDDPFAVMGAMEDAPLPPLPSAGPPAPPAEVDVAEDGEEDGDEEEGDDDEDGDEDDDEDDDFGNFEEVKAVGAEIDNNLSSVEEVPTASKGGSELATEDLKGDLFASSQGVLVAPSDDPFAVMGAMEDAPLPPLPSAGPPAPPAEVDVAEDGEEDGDEGDDDEEEGDDDEDGDEGDDDEDDDFGNFEEVKAVGAEIDNNLSSVEEVPTASKGGSELATEDLKGDLFASSQGVLVAPSDDPFAVMGAMEDAPLPPLPSAGPPAPPAEVDVAEDGDEDGDEGDDDEDDDFGNFEEVTDQACSGASFCGGDNDVDHCSFSPFVTKGGEGGALEAMSGNNQTEPLTAEGPLESQRTMDNKSFDFGDFCEEIKPSTSETADGIRLEAIRSEMLLSTSLPGAFCDINVLDYFDESMKSGENVGRAIRCLFVFRALSSACNLGTVWGKLVAAAHNEVGSGRELLNMLRTGEVPISETSESEKIGPYLQSLCECVRVSRCIIASLADLLCLDSEVNIRGSDQWPSLKIVRDSADIEDFWDDIQSISKELDISVDLSLSTIPVIRRRSPSGQEQSSKVCSLTLQSFELFGREPEATASVNWHNHTYMACAANLWANRVSINAPQ